jgi:hypothetical protein
MHLEVFGISKKLMGLDKHPEVFTAALLGILSIVQCSEGKTISGTSDYQKDLYFVCFLESQKMEKSSRQVILNVKDYLQTAQ